MKATNNPGRPLAIKRMILVPSNADRVCVPKHPSIFMFYNALLINIDLGLGSQKYNEYIKASL